MPAEIVRLQWKNKIAQYLNFIQNILSIQEMKYWVISVRYLMFEISPNKVFSGEKVSVENTQYFKSSYITRCYLHRNMDYKEGN